MTINKQIIQKKPPKRKNVSQKIQNGTVIKTRDEYFLDNNGYVKSKYKNNNNLYRYAVVVDSNRNDEIALIKLQSNGRYKVINNNNQEEKYNLYIKTKNNKNKPIKLERNKFEKGYYNYYISKYKANKMKQNCVKNSSKKIIIENKYNLKKLKGRK